jgi:short-subunit dehydrogenase
MLIGDTTMADESTQNRRKVAVITGASSGIGMATALVFAARDYDVVLAARRHDELKDVAMKCEKKGARALAVVADVSNDEAVHDLCTQAVEEFGHIDIWINDAGVLMVGKFEDLPLKDMQRLVDTNLFGVIHGTHAALKQFKDQDYGTVINVASVEASAAQPYSSIYSATKAAVRALDESIRMELELEGLADRIHICTVMPATIDTNIFQNAANYSGREVRAIEPVYDPMYVANRLFRLSQKPRREKFIGPVGAVLALERNHMRGTYERQVGRFTHKELLGDEQVPDTQGNLYAPLAYNTGIRGGWREKRTRADRLNIVTGASLAAIIGVIGFGFMLARRHRSAGA